MQFFRLISAIMRSLLVLLKSLLSGLFVLIVRFYGFVYRLYCSLYRGIVLYFFDEFVFFNFKAVWLFLGVPAFCVTCLGLFSILNIFSTEESFLLSKASLVLLFLVGLNTLLFKVVTRYFVPIEWKLTKLPFFMIFTQDLLIIALYMVLSVDVFCFLSEYMSVYIPEYGPDSVEGVFLSDESLVKKAKSESDAEAVSTLNTSAVLHTEKNTSLYDDDLTIARWQVKYIFLWGISVCMLICVLFIPTYPPGR